MAILTKGWTIVVAGLLTAALPSRLAAAEPPAPTEYSTKGAFLYHFAQYVNWPAESFPTSSAPFIIAVIDRDGAAAREIADTVRGKESSPGHPIRVVRVESPDKLPVNCQLIFVSRSAAADWPAIRTAVDERPVLVVGESPGFAEHGGAINFLFEGDRVGFEINTGRAGQLGLHVAPSLAFMARRYVHDKGL